MPRGGAKRAARKGRRCAVARTAPMAAPSCHRDASSRSLSVWPRKPMGDDPPQGRNGCGRWRDRHLGLGTPTCPQSFAAFRGGRSYEGLGALVSWRGRDTLLWGASTRGAAEDSIVQAPVKQIL